jgi:hypothetical protein
MIVGLIGADDFASKDIFPPPEFPTSTTFLGASHAAACRMRLFEAKNAKPSLALNEFLRIVCQSHHATHKLVL